MPKWSETEQRLRIELAACLRLIAHFRMTDLIYTHATLRLPGAERSFLINPYGLMFDEIRASDLLKIRPDGSLIDVGPGLVNLAGFVIHGAIHAAREDAHCVVHTHTRSGCAVAAQREGLLPVNQISLEFYNKVAYHDYEGIAYDFEEQQRLVRDVGDKPVVILRNHGLLTLGATVSQAFLRMYYLDKACDLQLAAQAGGQSLLLPSVEVCERTERQFSAPPPAPNAQLVSDPDGIDLCWQALLRLLDRIDPAYRD